VDDIDCIFKPRNNVVDVHTNRTPCCDKGRRKGDQCDELKSELHVCDSVLAAAATASIHSFSILTVEPSRILLKPFETRLLVPQKCGCKGVVGPQWWWYPWWKRNNCVAL
jgi:hypothetical protein